MWHNWLYGCVLTYTYVLTYMVGYYYAVLPSGSGGCITHCTLVFRLSRGRLLFKKKRNSNSKKRTANYVFKMTIYHVHLVLKKSLYSILNIIRVVCQFCSAVVGLILRVISVFLTKLFFAASDGLLVFLPQILQITNFSHFKTCTNVGLWIRNWAASQWRHTHYDVINYVRVYDHLRSLVSCV